MVEQSNSYPNGGHDTVVDEDEGNGTTTTQSFGSSYYGSLDNPKKRIVAIDEDGIDDADDDENDGDHLEGVFENEPLLPRVPLTASSPPTSVATCTDTAYFSSSSSCIPRGWNCLVFGWFTPVVDSVQHQLDMGIAPDLDSDVVTADGMRIPKLPQEDCAQTVTKLFEDVWKEEQQRIERKRRRRQREHYHYHRSSPSSNGDESVSGGGSTTADESDLDPSSSSFSANQTPSLAYCLWKAFSPCFIRAGFLKLIHDCLQFVGPQVLNGLINFLRTPSENLNLGIYLTIAVSVAQLLMSLTLRHYFFTCYRVGIRVRTALLLAIYKKSLTIDSSYYNHHPIGQITNLMSVDVQRLQDSITFLHAIWYSFLQIVLALYFLWQQLGPSCLAGVAVIFCSIPLTSVMASWMGTLNEQVMKRKDDRVQVNQEILTNMKVVKIQAWESSFRDKVNYLRKVELKQLLKYMLGNACVWLTWSAIPLLIALSTFAAYVTIAGQVLDVASALTALALFEILRFPLFMLPMVINNIVEGKVSLKRIEDFLSAPDRVAPRRLKNTSYKMVDRYNATFSYDGHPTSKSKQTNKITASTRLTPKGRTSITMDITPQRSSGVDREAASVVSDDESVAPPPKFLTRSSHSGEHLKSRQRPSSATNWGLNETIMPDQSLALKRVNFTCNEGEFIAVVGGVGSGKSTLLRAILGEIQRFSGDVAVRGKVAYFDQKPFIMNDTVKQNILFGNSDGSAINDAKISHDNGCNNELYDLALKSCSLQHDLEMLQNGDQTEIGERGITLSGGQKARVSMARVVYQDADIALLDDCLSAVDAHVGRALFDECIVKVLLQNSHCKDRSLDLIDERKRRTVILVTNALQYLKSPHLDRIFVMDSGTVVESGTYDELLTRPDSQFNCFLEAFNTSMAGQYDDGASEDSEEYIASDDENTASPGTGEHRVPSIRDSFASPRRRRSTMKLKKPDVEGKEKNDKLMTDEMAERAVGKVGLDVYKEWAKAAGGLWVAIPLLVIFSCEQGTTVLSNWWLTYWSHSATPDSKSQLHFLAIYGLINVVAIITGFLPMLFNMLLGLKASRKVSFANFL